jgi:hypothetical protein
VGVSLRVCEDLLAHFNVRKGARVTDHGHLGEIIDRIGLLLSGSLVNDDNLPGGRLDLDDQDSRVGRRLATFFAAADATGMAAVPKIKQRTKGRAALVGEGMERNIDFGWWERRAKEIGIFGPRKVL